MSNVALVDVKHLDGEPWEVADRAGKQALDCLDLLDEALEGFVWAARGSWLSQELHRTGEVPSTESFANSPLGRKLFAIKQEAAAARCAAQVAQASAAFDPRSV